MPNVIGLVAVCYGLWLLRAGFAHRRACRAAPASPPDEDRPLFIIGEVAPPLIFLGLGIAALEILLAYAMIGPSALFSVVDLVGTLFALFAYGTFIHLKTRYRLGKTGSG